MYSGYKRLVSMASTPGLKAPCLHLPHNYACDLDCSDGVGFFLPPFLPFLCDLLLFPFLSFS